MDPLFISRLKGKTKWESLKYTREENEEISQE